MTKRFGNKKRIILMGLVVLGTIPVASATTMILEICATYELKDNERMWKRAFYELERDGYLKKTNDSLRYKISYSGRRLNDSWHTLSGMVPSVQKWDGLLRVVIFDIALCDSKKRRRVRNILKSLNFISIQKSVYAQKYECKAQIKKIQSAFKLENEIILFESASKSLIKAYNDKLDFTS